MIQHILGWFSGRRSAARLEKRLRRFVPAVEGLEDGTVPTLLAPVLHALADYPLAVAAPAFNGDGKPYLVTANVEGLSVLLNHGKGTFTAATTIPLAGVNTAVAVGDFNGDGKNDLAVCRFQQAEVQILAGSGTGTFVS